MPKQSINSSPLYVGPDACLSYVFKFFRFVFVGSRPSCIYIYYRTYAHDRTFSFPPVRNWNSARYAFTRVVYSNVTACDCNSRLVRDNGVNNSESSYFRIPYVTIHFGSLIICAYLFTNRRAFRSYIFRKRPTLVFVISTKMFEFLVNIADQYVL